MESRVTLRPGARGTKKLAAEFGERLICVRYRYDFIRKRRLKTVEIVVDEVDWVPAGQRPTPEVMEKERQKIVGVRVAFAEEKLRRVVREAGGVWDRAMQVWLIPLSTANALGLGDRVVQVLPRNPERP